MRSPPYPQVGQITAITLFAGNGPVSRELSDDPRNAAVYPDGKALGGLAGPCCCHFLGMRWRKRECRGAYANADSNSCAHPYAYSPAIAGRYDRLESAEHQRTAWRDFPIPAIQY